ncbi:MAG TPA: glycosyltransferase [Planctomycetota bacterium]|nr:glycosyltransferase [Planctomycetota bacterium]
MLPVWNGERHLRRLLPALAAQEVEGGIEIRAVDSSSSDASRELLERAGAHVSVIPQREFRHGATRNLAAREALGEILVFLSQDAEPADRFALARLADAFEDPRVAGAYARLLPRPEDDPLTARTVLDLPEASAEPRLQALDGAVGGAAASGRSTPRERAELARFNDVAGAIRASVFRKIPFPDVRFGEDSAWAARALAAGWRIRFTPESVFYHAHRYGPRGAFERYRADAAFLREVHGWRVRPGVLSVARGLAHEVREDLAYLARTRPRGAWRHALRSPWLRGAQVLGQYAGSRGPLGGAADG